MEGRIEPYLKGRVQISHLIFADDLILFSNGSPNSARGINSLFRDFAESSGLKLNPAKSQAFLSKTFSAPTEFIASLGIKAGTLPVRYLGLPLLDKALSHSSCLPLLDKLRARIMGWKGHLLSFAGRVELVKTVLNSLQIFWSASFLLPQKTMAAVEKLFRCFLWGGPTLKKAMHHVDWKTICLPKQEGGLGIKGLKDWAKGSLGAKFWEIATRRSSLWVDWIYCRYIKSGSIWRISCASGSTKSWKAILSAREWIQPAVKFLIFSGREVNLWDDPWIAGKGLSDWLGETSYIFGPPKLASVAKLIHNDHWRKPQRWPPTLSALWEEISEEEVGGTGTDILIWPHSRSGSLSNSQAWEAVRNRSPKMEWTKLLWHSHQASKHSCCTWMASLNKSPTLDVLFKRGLVQDTRCKLCNREEETCSHLFLHCSYSAFIWTVILRHLGMKYIRQPNLASLLTWLIDRVPGGAPRTIMESAVTSTTWWIWSERNSRLRRGRSRHKTIICKLIMDTVKVLLRGKKMQEELSPQMLTLASTWGVPILQKQSTTTYIKWFPPEVGWAKSNSDGALSPDRAGYGALLRDNGGSFIEGIAVQCPRSSINILELKGFYEGIKLALKHRKTRLWLEGDSKTAVAWINGMGSPPWQAYRPLTAVRHALTSLSLWKASHICREANQPADLLAALRTQDGEESIPPGVIWNDFQTLIRTDAEGHPYPRIK
ncbi:hypothetical protein QJS10_CPA09g00577 [Acorus calamus]|uniref:Reverse transcriptase domain-containing protein n=1 Tax=Acorus calamus TaxID=4465 RepID=A0AAV9E427_ACOCL|nr:hypothetical protein QJS10_CPA09g00577 [Acorus calamus]